MRNLRIKQNFYYYLFIKTNKYYKRELFRAELY